jgi:hypothetical protein
MTRQFRFVSPCSMNGVPSTEKPKVQDTKAGEPELIEGTYISTLAFDQEWERHTRNQPQD